MLETGQSTRGSLYSLDNMPQVRNVSSNTSESPGDTSGHYTHMMSQDLVMTTKPPLPPEAHIRRPLSPPIIRRPHEVRESRRLSRQSSDQPPQPRHQSPPAWFHPVKPVSPPPASNIKTVSSSSSSKPPPPPRSPVTKLSSPPPSEHEQDLPPPPIIIQKPSVPPPPVPCSNIITASDIKSEPHQSPSQRDDDEDSDTVIDLIREK